MSICKKILLFIFAFCLPALTTITYFLGSWFDFQIDEYQAQSQLNQDASVMSTLDISYTELSSLANVYAPLIFNSDSRESILTPSGIQLWRYSQLTQKLTPLHASSQTKPVLKLTSSKLIPSKNAPLYFWHDQQAYMVVSVTLSSTEYLVAARLLSDQYLESLFSKNTALAKVSISPQATDNTSVSKQLSLNSLKANTPLFIKLTFSNSLSNQIRQQAQWVPIVIWGYGVFILLIGCFWLRFGIINPFKKLIVQLEEVDVNAKQLKPISASGCIEFSKLSDKVNSLLTENFQQKERAKITLEAIKEAVILTDTQAKVSYLNAQAELLLGTQSRDAMGQYLDSLLKSEQAFTPMICEQLLSKNHETQISKAKLEAASTLIVERSISTLRDHQQQVKGCVIVLRDITQEEALKSQLKRRANYDSVTGLLNRTTFEYELPSYIANASRFAVCYLDLEQFRLINENCGHKAGDTMLAMVANVMQQTLEKRGLLAHFGGDEFGLILCDYSEQEITTTLKLLINKISTLLIYCNDKHYGVGVSIGVAMGTNTQLVSELLKDADIACLAAKRKGSNQIHFYDTQDKDLCEQRNAPKWAARIAQAIEHNELVLYYQPIQNLSSSNQRLRLEILLRILEPNGKILPPAQIIAAAERFKLMKAVDQDIIRKSFLWLSLHEDIWDNHCISINLSGNSLGAEGMLDYIIEQQNRFEIPSECICFEITETSTIQNQQRAMDMIKQLRKRGFAFALDDFGTGLASYGYLRELPVDYVKIDGCFIKNLVNNDKDYAIVRSIHDICLAMGIETVAEFVENREIIDKLDEIGINYAQGYAIGRPQPLDQYLPLRNAKIA